VLQSRGIVTTYRHSLWCWKFDHGSHHHLTTHPLLPRPHAPFFPSISFLFFPPGRHNHVIPNTHTQPPPNPSIPAPSARLAQPPHTTQPHPPLPSSSYQTRTRQQQRLKPTPRFTPRSTLHTASQRARGRWLQPHPRPRPRPTPTPTSITTTQVEIKRIGAGAVHGGPLLAAIGGVGQGRVQVECGRVLWLLRRALASASSALAFCAAGRPAGRPACPPPPLLRARARVMCMRARSRDLAAVAVGRRRWRAWRWLEV
jgi:hypothetical protein